MPQNDAFLKGFNSMLQLMGLKQGFENAKELGDYRKAMAEVQLKQAETAQKNLEMAQQKHMMDMQAAELSAAQKYAGMIDDERKRQRLGVAQIATGLQVEAGLPGTDISRNIAQYAPDVKTMAEMLQSKGPSTIKSWVGPKGDLLNLPGGELPPPGYRPYSTGMNVEFDPKTGAFKLQTGVPGGGLPKQLEKDIATKYFDLTEQQARIGTLLEGFKPEYLEIPTRLKASWSELKEKSTIGQLSEVDRQAMADFKDWQATALRNINLYIKEITGAQMSAQEADRLRAGMPDPGEGIFGGDSPTVYISKMRGIVKELNRAAIRYQVMLKGGISEDQIKLMAAQDALPTWTEIKGMIDATAATIEARIKLRNPKASKESIETQVLNQLKEVYGIGNI